MIISLCLSAIDLSFANNNIHISVNFSWIKDINIDKVIGCLFIALCDLVEFGAVYIAYQIAEPALLQPIRFTRILFSIAFSYIFLLEKPTKQQIIGAILIILANIFSIFYSHKKQSK